MAKASSARASANVPERSPAPSRRGSARASYCSHDGDGFAAEQRAAEDDHHAHGDLLQRRHGASVGSAPWRRTRPCELAPGVWRIPLIGDYVNGFMLRDDDGQVTLIDMGIASSGREGDRRAAARSGRDPSESTRLMLTHCHPDHAGGTAYVSEQTGRPVDVHADDAEFVRTGTQPDVDPSSRSGSCSASFAEPKAERSPSARSCTDGQVVARVAGGIRVVHTPGHSPGHASYLHEDSGTLITRRRHLQRPRPGAGHRDAVLELRDDQQTAHRLGELEYTHRGVHPRPGDPGPARARRSGPSSPRTTSVNGGGSRSTRTVTTARLVFEAMARQLDRRGSTGSIDGSRPAQAPSRIQRSPRARSSSVTARPPMKQHRRTRPTARPAPGRPPATRPARTAPA